jgi:hypothetical protein
VVNSWALIGASGVDLDEDTQDIGAAYVFERRTDGWQYHTKLAATDGAAGDRFGQPVALSVDGERAVVAASGKIIDEENQLIGAVYVFDRIDGAWTQTAKLTPPSGNDPGEGFGYAVSMSGDVILVGNFHVTKDDKEDVGVVYVYERNAGQWKQADTLRSPTEIEGERFGYAVSVDGDWAFVGASGYDLEQERPYPYNTREGMVHVFQRTTGQWRRVSGLMASDPQEDAHFGNAVEVSGSRAIVGAYFFWQGDPYEHYRYGAAYVFEHGGDGWQEMARITPPIKVIEENPFDLLFGRSVSISGDAVLVGSFGLFASGVAFIY